MSCTVPRETRGEVHLSDSETLRLGDAMSCWGSAAGWGWSLVGTHTHTRRHTRRSRPRHAHTHTAHTGDRTATGHDGTHAAARRGAVPVRSHGSRLSTRMETVGINEREKISTRCALVCLSALAHFHAHFQKKVIDPRSIYLCLRMSCPAASARAPRSRKCILSEERCTSRWQRRVNAAFTPRMTPQLGQRALQLWPLACAPTSDACSDSARSYSTYRSHLLHLACKTFPSTSCFLI